MANRNAGKPVQHNRSKIYDIVYTVGDTSTKIRGLNRTQCRDQISQLSGYTMIVYMNGLPLARCSCGFYGGCLVIRNGQGYEQKQHSLTGVCELCDGIRYRSA